MESVKFTTQIKFIYFRQPRLCCLRNDVCEIFIRKNLNTENTIMQLWRNSSAWKPLQENIRRGFSKNKETRYKSNTRDKRSNKYARICAIWEQKSVRQFGLTCCATGSKIDSIILVWNTGISKPHTVPSLSEGDKKLKWSKAESQKNSESVHTYRHPAPTKNVRSGPERRPRMFIFLFSKCKKHIVVGAWCMETYMIPGTFLDTPRLQFLIVFLFVLSLLDAPFLAWGALLTSLALSLPELTGLLELLCIF